MDISQTYSALRQVAITEFSDVVIAARILMLSFGEPLKLRLQIIDNSFLDVHISVSGRYSYHWERRLISGDLYRHDNAPHNPWRDVLTFPKHFHEASEANVTASYLSDDPQEALRTFLTFVRMKLADAGTHPQS